MNQGKFKTDMIHIEKDKNITKEEHYANQVKKWVAYWRGNPHRFVEDYFNVTLKPFQKVLLYNFAKNTKIILVATRGIGKSFITAIYACAMAILYPNSRIVILCDVMSQAENLVNEKILSELVSRSKLLDLEIYSSGAKDEGTYVFFRNGSQIYATNASENRRGLRATILILDEARMIPQVTVETVGLPFLNYVRPAGFRDKPKYKNLIEEETQALFLTSAWFKDHYFYKKYYIPSILDMLGDNPLTSKNTVVYNFGGDMPLRAGLITPQRAEENKQSMDSITHMMEIESVFYGEGKNSFFKASEINNCRTLTRAFYPPSKQEWIRNKGNKRKKWDIPKQIGEIRLISCDIALKAGNDRDNSIYSLIRIIPENGTFKKQYVHIEAHNGVTPSNQARRIKQLFYDFNTDKVIIDRAGVGISVYHELMKVTYDNDRDLEYPAWSDFNVPDFDETSELAEGRLPVMYGLQANKDINHKIAIGLKNAFMEKKIELPLPENLAREYLNERVNLTALDGEMQSKYLAPFVQTTSLTSEMVNLSYNLQGGQVVLSQKRGQRKDRYSSVAYGNFLADMIIKDLKEDKKEEQFLFLT